MPSIDDKLKKEQEHHKMLMELLEQDEKHKVKDYGIDFWNGILLILQVTVAVALMVLLVTLMRKFL